MSNTQIQVLKSQELCGRQFKVYGTQAEPMFMAKDVARMIHHSDVSMMMRQVDIDEKLTQTMFVSGQRRDVWFLTEYGLYEVLMQSRKPIAKQFKKGVKQILRSIRQTGEYVPSRRLPKPRERSAEFKTFFEQLSKFTTTEDEHSIAHKLGITQKHVHEVIVGRKASYQVSSAAVQVASENRKNGIIREEPNERMKQLCFNFINEEN